MQQCIKFPIEPMKIIFKYKNNERKTQNITYIYVGNLAERYSHILDKIENLDMYDTLMKLTQKDIKELTQGFGELWVTHFFNIYHISAFINKIKSDRTMKKDLLEKYDEEWLKLLINKINSDIIFKKIKYSYANQIKQQYKQKMGKKIEFVQVTKDDLINFKTQTGGYDEDYGDDNDFSVNDIMTTDNVDDDDEQEPDKDGESLQDMIDFSQDNTLNLYEVADIDKNATKTSNAISKIIDDSSQIKYKEDMLIPFDTRFDNKNTPNKLEDSYVKKFIYNQFIFKNDTVKNLRNKICCSIRNNDKFGENNYLVPTRIYLWSEYIINETIERIMIGQKWTKKNLLLPIDAEPLPISIYENNEPPVDSITDVFKIYADKIKYDDDDTNIIEDYSTYILNNEIYMVDIYNELGMEYSVSHEKLKKVFDIYFRIYFPKIKYEELADIIAYLNGKSNGTEGHKNHEIFDTLYNDVLIENEITNFIEKTRVYEFNEYSKFYTTQLFVTNAVIHLNLDVFDKYHTENDDIIQIHELRENINTIYMPKLDLYRIFNDFIPTDRYPFLQYIMPDGKILFSYHKEFMDEFVKTEENVDTMNKWFDSSLQGLSFKIKIVEGKYISINISEIGKVEYKTQWKEENNATIDDITATYEYVKKLICEINKLLVSQPNKTKIRVPSDDDFRFAFINCIQRFKMPNGALVNHNDLTEYCRFFYPYVALVVEPTKYKANGSEIPKYGTYLKYKRVSKFDSKVKIEQRIVYFLRNYEITTEQLVDEITRRFNITEDHALEEIKNVKHKYASSLRSKKMSYGANVDNSKNTPKIKPAGIDVNIQGKTPDKYKIGVNGARNKEQLYSILQFINILLYLYTESYIAKTKRYVQIKDKMHDLVNIAKRHGKVNDVVEEPKEATTIKQIITQDKQRFGYEPDEGQNQWSRLCQNSGKTHRRQPQGDLREIKQAGYRYNSATGNYEKKFVVTSSNGKREQIIIKTVKLQSTDELTGTKTDKFYTCDPDYNGDHMHIGFLTKSNNPFGECMPCCFKKNILETRDKEKRAFFAKCLSNKKVNQKTEFEGLNNGDVLYVLRDLLRLNKDRIGLLPNALDYFTNIRHKRKFSIKNHYLTSTDGYFLKYGVELDNYSFIKTLACVFDESEDVIRKTICDFFKNDKDQLYYMSLSDGDICNEMRINDFIEMMKSDTDIGYNYFRDMLKIKGLFTEDGIVPIVIAKTITTKQVNLQTKLVDELYIEIDKSMVNDFKYFIQMFETYDILLLVKDEQFYYPLIEIQKPEVSSRNIKITKLFNKKDYGDLIKDIVEFIVASVDDVKINIPQPNLSAKETYLILNKIAIEHPRYTPILQVVDVRFKCKYIITKNNTIIPVMQSGILDFIPTICNRAEGGCINRINKLSIDQLNSQLAELFDLSKGKLKIEPQGLYYDSIDDGMVDVIGIITTTQDLVPIKNTPMPEEELKKFNVTYKLSPLYYTIDQKLITYDKNDVGLIDDRIIAVNTEKFKGESYQLFRFELSNAINKKEHKKQLCEIKKIIANEDLNALYKFILKFVDDADIIHIVEHIPNIDYYQVKNKRILCEGLNENKCSKNIHCQYFKPRGAKNGNCGLAITHQYKDEFARKLSNELLEQKIKLWEFLQENNNYVSDIVNYNNFDEVASRGIIKTNAINLKSTLERLFGNLYKTDETNELKDNTTQNKHALRDVKDAYIQTIISANLSIMRAYVNGYYWYHHELYDIESRNLGWQSEYQTEFLNLFRSKIIDWLHDSKNMQKLGKLNEADKRLLNNDVVFNASSENIFMVNTYIVNLMESHTESNYGLLELLILNDLHHLPIVIMFNDSITYFINKFTIKKINTNDVEQDDYLNVDNICINLNIINENQYPNMVEVMYFKE